MKKLSEEKKNKLLSYVESIAVVYYYKHSKVFEHDAVSLNDLKQEAKLVCLKMFKKFGKLDGKKKFDIKKFICRAVGWKMRDMLSCAITEAEKVTTPRNKYCDSREEIGYEFTEKIEQERTPSLKYGFNMKEIYKYFSGKDLTILQNMIKYNCRKRDIAKLYPNDSWPDIKYTWKTRIKPKIKSILAKIQKERE